MTIYVTVMRARNTVSMIIHLFNVPTHDRLSTIVAGQTVVNLAGRFHSQFHYRQD